MTQRLEVTNKNIKAVILTVFVMSKSSHLENTFKTFQIELLEIKTVMYGMKSKSEINGRLDIIEGNIIVNLRSQQDAVHSETGKILKMNKMSVSMG